MKAILSELGVAFNASDYIAKYGNEALLKLAKKYTVRTVDRMTKIPQVTKLYRMIKADGFKVIEFPKFALNGLMATPPTQRMPITDIDIQLPEHERNEAITYTGRSNPNQQLIVRHIVDKEFSKPLGGVTLNLLAGMGKSYVAMDIIGQMKLKTLVVVPNTYLLEQWVTILREYFPTAKIGTLYGKHKEDGDIIVGIINTVSDLQEMAVCEKRPLPNVGKTLKFTKVKTIVAIDDIFKQVGLTIFDESHMYVSKEFRKVFRRIWSRYTLGLSATPDIREDKLDIIHQMWLGPILQADTLEGFNASQDTFESDAHLVEYHALNEHCKFNVRDDGIIDYASIVEAIVNDPHRNTMIVEEIVTLMEKGYFTFVFSDRRSHLEHLYDLLEIRLAGQNATLELPESDRKVILYGGSTEQTINKAKQLSTIILTTYAYSSTGVSVVRMNALVLTTPRRSNMKQIINRVFRLGSDQTIKRMIVDFVDAKLPLKKQVTERVKAYKERGCNILKKKVSAAQ